VKIEDTPGAVMGDERCYFPDVMSGWSATIPPLRWDGKAHQAHQRRASPPEAGK